MIKKSKCLYNDYCKEKPEYCHSHFWKWRNKAEKRGIWIIIILLTIVGIALILSYLLLNVDETKFCENKIKDNFPEIYKIEMD